MRLFTCPICGGKLNIKIGTEYAACDSCGSLTKINPEEAERLREIYRSAERAMRLNSVEGYEEAFRQLDSISFIEEARKKRVECEKRLQDLQADLQRRQAQGSASEQQNTGFAGVLLAVTLVFVRPLSRGWLGWSFCFSKVPYPPEPRRRSSPSRRWQSCPRLSTG